MNENRILAFIMFVCGLVMVVAGHLAPGIEWFANGLAALYFTLFAIYWNYRSNGE